MSRSADQAYEQIRAQIIDGKLAPGQQLTEVELAGLTGVSRTPVREALRRLEAEALVVRSDSARIFVAAVSADDLAEMYTLRAMLEGHAASLAATRITPDELAALEKINRQIAASIKRKGRPDHVGFLEGNAQFHATLIASARSPRLRALLGALVEQPIVRRTVQGYEPRELARSHADHAELIAALKSADADWAQAVMSAHIRRAYYSFMNSQRTP